MQAYVLRRLIAAVFTVVVISMLVFWLLRVAPGDPATLVLGLNATDERVQAIHEELGLDKPLAVQYVDWMRQVVTGDLGESFVTHSPVGKDIVSRLPVTLELLILTFGFTVLIGIPLGIISAFYQNSLGDYVVRFFAILGLAIPNFWIATLAILIPLQMWGYAPPLNQTISIVEHPWDNLRQMVPPALILGLSASAGIMRLTRSALLEVLRQDYIRTARAKGLRDRVVVLRHALKNSMVPVITVLGLQVSGLLAGTVIIETVFNLNGLGRYVLEALVRKDFAVAQTMTLYIAIIVVTMNLVVDVLYAWLDPRIRYS
jgi:peptide/nickel transport system permease protein